MATRFGFFQVGRMSKSTDITQLLQSWLRDHGLEDITELGRERVVVLAQNDELNVL